MPLLASATRHREGPAGTGTLTRADGTFDIGGLPPGSYHLDTDMPDIELVETEDDPIELQPHGCAETHLDVQDNTVGRGRVAVMAGMRNRLRFVSAFTVDGVPGLGSGGSGSRGSRFGFPGCWRRMIVR